jgi:hypothetical protein
MARIRLRIYSATAFAAATCIGLVANAADRAATVEFAIGDVHVVSLNGQSRQATKGQLVQNGDTVDTGSGRTQLRFTDGAYVSLQPQSKFRIDDYRFEGKTDGSERGFFSLLSGGMRTITGLVGRTNRRSYQVSTSVATIGIRGTEYKIGYTNSITGSVGEGAIDVCNSAGCVLFNSGESFLVPGPQSIPQLTMKQVDLPPPPPTDTSTLQDLLVSGDQVGPSGLPSNFQFTGTVSGLFLMNNGDGFLSSEPTTVDFDSAGIPTLINGNPVGAVTDVFNNGFVALWRDAPTSTRALSPGTFAIVGMPTPFSEIQTLSPQTASYSMIAATTPAGSQTLVAPFGPVDGKLMAASLTANFSAGSVDARVVVDVVGKQLDMQVNGMTIRASGGGTGIFSGASSTQSSSTQMFGFFAGKGAAFAGLGYSGFAYDPATLQSVSASGGVAFEKKQ